MFSVHKAFEIFNQSIADYHIKNDVDTSIQNPHKAGSLEALLYHKNWIDTVQWHLEDIIRDPKIDPVGALAIKRRIDSSNQERTDMVEQIDDFFLADFRRITPKADARLNTESLAWAIDRLSILALKIYHMREEAERKDASAEHQNKCAFKLNILLEQKQDMLTSIAQLIEDIEAGNRVMKVYRQMKMYNDPSLNPVLYAQKK